MISLKIKKAFTTLQESYSWGNYRFKMSHFEMTTSGGEDCDYDDENDRATMTVFADNVKSFTFTIDGYNNISDVILHDRETALVIISNLANGNYEEGEG